MVMTNTQKPRYKFNGEPYPISEFDLHTSYYKSNWTLKHKIIPFIPLTYGICKIGYGYRIGQFIIADSPIAFGHYYDYFYSVDNNFRAFMANWDKYTNEFPTQTVVPWVDINLLMSNGDRIQQLREYLNKVRDYLGRYPIMIVEYEHVKRLQDFSSYVPIIIQKYSNEPLLLEDIGTLPDGNMILGVLDRYRAHTSNGFIYAENFTEKWESLGVKTNE